MRNRRISEPSKKTIALKNSALNSPERHQSSRCPWSSAANSNANPALAYKKPAKLGTCAPGFLGAGAGTPYQIQNAITGVNTAGAQNIQCQERCSRHHPYSDGARFTAPSTELAYNASVNGKNRGGIFFSAKVSVSG